jgi:hypothetical protein
VGPTSSTRVNDLYVYSVFNGLLDKGLVPYRDFGFEYPPLSLVPIRVPDLVGGAYATWLGVEMLLGALVLQACAGALGGRRAAWAFVLAPLLVGAQIRTHFDVVPAAMVVGALVLLVRDRPVWGMVLLGVGGLTKLFPLLLVPIAAAWLVGRGERRAAVRGVAACAAVVLIGLAPFALHGTGGLRGMISFHLDRPVQIESTPATVVFALGDPVITGTNLTPDRYKSNGVDDPVAKPAEAVCVLIMLAVLCLAVAAAARRPDADGLLVPALAGVLAFVALGKVLSPQYMIWLAPFAAIAWGRGRRGTAVGLAAAVALTQAWFPERYFDLINRDGTVVAEVAARNVILLAVLASTAAGLARWPRPGPARARSGRARP